MSEKCYICKKEVKGNTFVWFSSRGKYMNIYLCKSHYLRMWRNKEIKLVDKKYKDAKPTTKKWRKRCDELQKAFDGWMEEELKNQKIRRKNKNENKNR